MRSEDELYKVIYDEIAVCLENDLYEETDTLWVSRYANGILEILKENLLILKEFIEERE